jgi:hypothetical protein
VLERAFEYWRNIDKTAGDRIHAATLDKRQPMSNGGRRAET